MRILYFLGPISAILGSATFLIKQWFKVTRARARRRAEKYREEGRREARANDG